MPRQLKRDANQERRFKEAARSIGADECPDALDRAFDKVVKPAVPGRKKSAPKAKKPKR